VVALHDGAQRRGYRETVRYVLGLLTRAMATRDEIFDDANGDLAIGELESAIEKYQRCVDLDPNFFDGWHALGMALMKLGRFAEAIQAGEKAVELRPNDQIGWTSLSLFYNRAGNIKEAEVAGTKAKILSWGGKISQGE
jgi:Flp pilus assembly protein TadD